MTLKPNLFCPPHNYVCNVYQNVCVWCGDVETIQEAYGIAGILARIAQLEAEEDENGTI